MKLWIVLFCLIGYSLASNLYVDCGQGNDNNSTNNCQTEANPCFTLDHIFELAEDGDSIFIAEAGAACTLQTLAVLLRNLTIQSMTPGYYAELNYTGISVGAKQAGRPVEVSFSWITFSNMDSRDKHGGALAIFQNSYVTVTNCQFLNCNASKYGGAIWVDNYANLTVWNSTFRGNHAKQGGAIAAFGNLTLGFGLFDSNFATQEAGAILMDPKSQTAYYIHNSTFINDQAGDQGGAIETGSEAIAYIGESNFTECWSGDEGGAASCFGPCVFNETLFLNCETAGNGGALVGNLGIYESNFTGCKSDGYAGAVLVSDVNCIIFDTVFQNNYASLYGGAVALTSSGRVQLTDSLFTQNLAPKGGALYLEYSSKATLTDTAFEYNHASTSGAGIYCTNSNLNVVDCSFTSNLDTSNNSSDDLACSRFPALTYCKVNTDGSLKAPSDCSPAGPAASSAGPLPTVAIVGIVLGAVGVICIVSIIIYAVTCFRKNRKIDEIRESHKSEEAENLLTKKNAPDYDD